MNAKALLLVVALQACIAGLLLSQAKPHWFRINGKTPSRRKIGAIWGALAVACALGAVWQPQAPADAPADVVETATERVIQADEAISESPLDAIDQAATAEAVDAPGEDGAMDAARPVEDTAIPVDVQSAKNKAGARRE